METKDYIVLSKLIRDRIKTERKKRKISGVTFSTEVLGLSPSYMSHVEKGVIQKLERLDLEKILGNILDISGEELSEYINNLLHEDLHLEDEVIELKNQLDNNEEELRILLPKAMLLKLKILAKEEIRNPEQQASKILIDYLKSVEI